MADTRICASTIERATSPHWLPVFRGYTVDIRLREFRRVAWGKRLEFIPFDSPKGRRLLRRLKQRR